MSRHLNIFWNRIAFYILCFRFLLQNLSDSILSKHDKYIFPGELVGERTEEEYHKDRLFSQIVHPGQTAQRIENFNNLPAYMSIRRQVHAAARFLNVEEVVFSVAKGPPKTSNLRHRHREGANRVKQLETVGRYTDGLEKELSDVSGTKVRCEKYGCVNGNDRCLADLVSYAAVLMSRMFDKRVTNPFEWKRHLRK